MSARPIIGLTGGIASGKSELGHILAACGASIVDADVVAREVVAPGTDGFAAVVARFGDAMLATDGTLDRAALRMRVFDDADARSTLEAIIHPRVRVSIQTQCKAAAGMYVVAAIPLLAEGGGRQAYPYLDRIVVVDVPVETQRLRLVARDGISLALADRIIAAQATRQQRLAIADDVVVNTGDRLTLQVTAIDLDARYRALLPRGG